MLLSPLLALALLQSEPLTSGRPAPPGQTCYDVRHYALAIRVLPDEKRIDGTVDVRARLVESTREIVLDLDDRLEVSGVALGAQDDPVDLPFEHSGGELRIGVGEVFDARGVEPGSEFVLHVAYGGEPRVAPRPPWDGGFQWERTPSGAHWIATSNQMQGADLWWPCKDQPDDEPDEGATIAVTVPTGLVCASNGRLTGHATLGDETTWLWSVSTPINAYGIALNIAPYEVLTQEYTSVAGDTFPISYWVLPENVENGKQLLADVLRQMRWFEETFGPYPFRADKYGVVETPHLGMEHQSIIAYGNRYRGNPWGEDQGFDFLHLHEFAHEWFANLVTCRNWKDFWIHESFATYAEALYAEHVKGSQGYRQRMSELRKGHLNRAPIAPREPTDTAAIYFDGAGIDIYSKGAWTLHTLRFLVGDEAFFQMLHRVTYPDPELERTSDGAACRFADTEEIRAIAERAAGTDLGWFFEVYLRQPELPKLVAERGPGRLTLQWEVPGDRPFPLPVEVRVDGELRRIEMPDGEAALEIDAPEVEIDPDHWLLRDETGE